jgi:peptidoglycan/LPS O-acetylase OafA/YrhL
MSVTAAKQERFHFLDGLRAVAASMVVIHHSFTANILRYCQAHHIFWLGAIFRYIASYGVDLFFVLSGVVLLRPYLRRQRKLKVGDYFIRRATRIYPPYFIAVLFAAAVIWYINAYPTWYNVKGMSVPFSWKETLKEMAVINLDGVYYNLAWWSLQIEILFYILVPLIIIVYPYRHSLSNVRLTITIVTGVALTILLQLFFNQYLPYIFTLNYLQLSLGMALEYPVCFLMGTLLAAHDFSRKHALAFFAGGAVLVAGGSWYEPLLHSGYGLIFAAVITLGFNAVSFRKMLDTPFMVWLGERSYSLFLVHFSVFYLVDNIVARFTPERNTAYAILTRGIGIPLALFAGMLLFHFVERKFARGLVTGNAFWPWQMKGVHIRE